MMMPTPLVSVNCINSLLRGVGLIYHLVQASITALFVFYGVAFL